MSKRGDKLSDRSQEKYKQRDFFNVVVVYAVAEHQSAIVHRRLNALLKDEYGPRFQSMVKIRGIDSTETVEVQVQCNLWDLRTLGDEEIVWRWQTDCGHAFLIITDSTFENLGKELAKDIEEDKDDAIVMVTQARTFCDDEDDVIDVIRQLQRFCHYLNSHVALVVPPKKALRCVQRNKFQRLVKHIRQLFGK